MTKILLCNWTHRDNTAGGNESRYGYLKQIFPKAELISCVDLFKSIENHEEVAKKMDEYYIKRYNENNDILIIRDASVGGILDTSHIPQIIFFANPYRSLGDVFIFGRGYWGELIKLQKKAKGIKIATSYFMKKDMEKNKIIPDRIIHNPVDVDFFKPLKNKKELRKKYKIPKNRKIGIWVGSSNNPIKNIKMIYKLIVLSDVFWIIITKNKSKIKNKNLKLFCNVNKKTMRDLYNCADFLVFTSQIEGFGMVPLEAMACNLPCIVSHAGYFYDFWDKRVGIKIKWNSLQSHINAINSINKIKTNPRQVILDQNLDLKTWKEKWEKLIWK